MSIQRIRAWIESGRVQDALAALRPLALARPRDAEVWWLLGRAYYRLGDHTEAKRALSTAVSHDPDHADALTDLGLVLVVAGERNTPRQLADRVLARRPNDVQATFLRGLALRTDGDVPGAIQSLQRAVALSPRSALFRANLASAFEASNQNGTAEAVARSALEIDPHDGLALQTLARLLRVRGALDDAEQHLTRLVDSSTANPPERAWALAERGLVRDLQHRSDEAFADFCASNAILADQPAARAIDRHHFPALLTAIGAWLSQRPDPPPRAPVSTERVLFFVGFPRSGTTLTQQLLEATGCIVGAEEKEVLADTIRDLAHIRPGGVAYPFEIDSLTDAERTLLARRYIARLTALTPNVPSGGFRMDKMPLNVIHFPFIRLLFPDAPVIMALRDPRDCVLSALMQTFTPTVAMVHFATLPTTAAVYAKVMDIYLHYSSDPQLYPIRYESLVTDLRGTLEPVLTALGIPWTDAIGSYYKQTRGRHIATPSHQDVQKPLFQRASGRWRRYLPRLAPILPTLEPYVLALGYPPTPDAQPPTAQG